MAANPHFAYDPDDGESTLDEPGDYEWYTAHGWGLPPPLTHAQRGRLGGLATVAKYGVEYMRALARKGGEAYNIKYVAGGLGGPVKPRKGIYDDELPY